MKYAIAGVAVELSKDAPSDKLVAHPEVWAKIEDAILLRMGSIPLEGRGNPQDLLVKEPS